MPVKRCISCCNGEFFIVQFCLLRNWSHFCHPISSRKSKGKDKCASHGHGELVEPVTTGGTRATRHDAGCLRRPNGRSLFAPPGTPPDRRGVPNPPSEPREKGERLGTKDRIDFSMVEVKGK